MPKIKICATGNSGKFNYFIVEKNKDFFIILSKILWQGFGIQGDSIVYESYVAKNEKYITKKKNITNFVDKYEKFKNEKARVDIFYGKDKIFFSIYTSLSMRKKFLKFLEANASWKKVQKIKS